MTIIIMIIITNSTTNKKYNNNNNSSEIQVLVFKKGKQYICKTYTHLQELGQSRWYPLLQHSISCRRHIHNHSHNF